MLGQAPDGDADRDVQRIVHSDDHARDALEARGAADYPAWGEASRLLSVEGADRGSTHARAKTARAWPSLQRWRMRSEQP